jgi:hypothetical protein
MALHSSLRGKWVKVAYTELCIGKGKREIASCQIEFMGQEKQRREDCPICSKDEERSHIVSCERTTEEI